MKKCSSILISFSVLALLIVFSVKTIAEEAERVGTCKECDVHDDARRASTSDWGAWQSDKTQGNGDHADPLKHAPRQLGKMYSPVEMDQRIVR